MVPMKLIPAFKDYLWGGARLVAEFGKNTPMRPVAEAWEVSCHPDGPSVVANGPHAGRTLAQVLAAEPGLLGSRGGALGEFPILIKLIDAKQDLSLQVHPDDDYARRAEGQLGKNEMWYIVDAEPGARIILGFDAPLSREELGKAIASNTILEHVASLPVARGDCYCIPAGMLHAIGKGILIAEVQQSSNVTYRVYDYDRRDAAGNPRELHVEKALDVTDTSLAGQRSAFPPERREGCVVERLCDWRYFASFRYTVDGTARLTVNGESFGALLCLEGALEVCCGEEALALGKGDSAFLPAGLGQVLLKGRGMGLYTTM